MTATTTRSRKRTAAALAILVVGAAVIASALVAAPVAASDTTANATDTNTTATEAATTAADASWHQFGYDNRRTGADLSRSGPRDVTLNWSYSTGEQIISSPAVKDGTVYVGSDSSDLYAIDAEDGSEQWSFSTGDKVRSSPAIGDGTVFVGSEDGNVYAIDRSSGTEAWSASVGTVYSSPAVDPGSDTVYVGTDGGELIAFNTDTGDRRWTYSNAGTIASSPAIANGRVFVGSNDGTVHAVDAGDGSQEWTYSTGGRVISSPAVKDGTVYVGSFDTKVYALDASSGTQEWTFDTGDWVAASPSVADGTVYVGSFDGNLYAIDATSGTEEWSIGTSGTIGSSAAVVDDTLYVGTSENGFLVVDHTGSNGRVVDRYQTFLQWSIQSSPAVADGRVFVGNGGGDLFAFTEAEPDTTVTGYTVSASSVAVNETLDVTATVENNGSADGSIDVTLYTDGTAEATQTVTVAAGATEQVSFATRFATTGTHTVRVNNESQTTIDVTNASTLQVDVESGSVTPESVDESTTVTHSVEFSATNVSQDGSTDRFYVVFPDRIDASRLSPTDVTVTDKSGAGVSISSSLAVVDGPDNDGVEETITFAVSPDASGTVDVDVTVDTDVTWPDVGGDTGFSIAAAVDDSRSRDAPATGIASVTVTDTDGTGPSNIDVTGYSVSSSSVVINETLDVTATLRNVGTTDGSIDVTLYTDGTAETTKTVPVGGGATEQVSFATRFATTGTHTVRVNNESQTTIDVIRPRVGISNGSGKPSTVGEDRTVNHDFAFSAANVSQDGLADRLYLIFPDGIDASRLAVDDVSVGGAAVSSGARIVDGPDGDGVDETIAFDINPDASGTVEVFATVSVDVTWPNVDGATEFRVEAAVSDSRSRDASPTRIETVTVRDTDGSGGSANVSVTGYVVSSTQVETNETLDVTATVENDGNADGVMDVTLSTDGSAETTKTITVAAGATEQVSFATSFAATGAHTVTVTGQSPTTITVVQNASPPDLSGNGAPAKDHDGDGLYEDVDGDGSVTAIDVTVLLDALVASPPGDGPDPAFFDFNGDGSFSAPDVTALLDLVVS